MNDSWTQATLDALALNPQIPPAYDTRTTITSVLTFALTRHFRISGGISAVELEPLEESPFTDSQLVTRVIAAFGYDQEWEAGSSSHRLGATFALRSATEALGSDLIYTRYFGEAGYRYER